MCIGDLKYVCRLLLYKDGCRPNKAMPNKPSRFFILFNDGFRTSARFLKRVFVILTFNF